MAKLAPRRRTFAAATALLALAAAAPTAMRRTVDRATTASDFSVRDLASLTDFGRTDNGEDQGPVVGLSLDGRVAAMIVRRPDLDRNVFDQSLVLVSLAQSRVLATYPLSMQPVPWAFDIRGLQTANGNFIENRPTWSPDGRRIAFLAPGLGGSQIAVLELATGQAAIVTSATGGATDVSWDGNSRDLTFSTQLGLADDQRAIDREAVTGYHYDRRIAPMVGARPGVPGSLPAARRHIDIASGIERAAEAGAPESHPRSPAAPSVPASSSASATAGGNTAWIKPADPARWGSPAVLEARVAGALYPCPTVSCRGRLINLWWSGKDVVYLRREGWGDSVTAVYRWRPGSAPRRKFSSAGVLIGCTVATETLICGREGSLRPRYLWGFNLRTGRDRTLFAPNGGALSVRQWRVVRLRWRGAHGAQGYGDLVIPRTAPPAGGYPLVVVQYHTRGFLRGAVGDEYPILPLAGRGFAVLSVEGPKYYPLLVDDGRPRTIVDAMRLAQDDNNDRRQQQDNLERAVAAARAALPIDPERMAITGISDAAAGAVFALVNSRLFSVAALGSPDIDRETLAMGGPALAEEFHALGFPSSVEANEAFYRPLSLSANVDRLKVPILFQLPETEYLVGLSSYTRLAEAEVPVDLYVFPGEHHVKAQPAHKLAVYNRNLAWLSFWLKGDADGFNQTEITRWRALRDRSCQLPPERRLPAQLCAHASTLTSSESRK